MLQGQRVTVVPGGAPVDAGIPRLPGDMEYDAGLPTIKDELGRTISLVRSQRQAPRRSGGMAMHHVQRGTPFGMAVGSDQITLNNQPVPVFHQRMPHETQHRAGAGGSL